ncbi:MAG: ATP-binding protein, partial [Steroidobacteraceae bacterium]
SRACHVLAGQQLEAATSTALAKQHAARRPEELAAINRATTIFLSNISHELRTPLTLILSPIEQLIGGGVLEHSDRDKLEVALRGARRLLKLIDALLRFSRAEEARVDAYYEPTDLAQLTADLSSMFRSVFEQASVAFCVECSPLGEAVYVDPEMWEQIVLNLISNALKFTVSGMVGVCLRLSDESVELEVSDTGCGISEGDLPHLFERFFRGEARHARSAEGTGIGLSLVQELVKAHHGQISAKSSLGVGTTVSVRIPRGKGHLPVERIRTSTEPSPFRTGALPYVEEALSWLSDAACVTTSGAGSEEILVVEDNADMRTHLCSLLGKHWRVTTASEGGLALERIRAHPPDLVLADIMMRGLDGFSLLRELRKNPRTAEIPVLLLSARAGEEASAEGLKAGADDYIVKPFSARDLMARIDLHLARARAKAHAHKARESAEEAGRARDEFFATLFHELRTPLASLQTWIELLKSSRLPVAEIPSALEALETSSQSLNGLVQDLLDYSAVIRGELRVEPHPSASILPAILAVVRGFHPVALMKGVTLECTPGSVSGPVRVDALRLQQVMWNLISNSIRHTPPGGRIDVTVQTRDHILEIVVRDTGAGIPADELPHIFGRYWRGKGAGGASRGLGLGLAIVRRIVELHGGSIAAHSAGSGCGAEFTARLPVSDGDVKEESYSIYGADDATTRLQYAVTAAASEASRDMHIRRGERLEILEGVPHAEHPPLRILLVEDDDGLARACQRLLSAHGHRVVRANGCAGAIVALERESIDVIISDVHLIDGDAIDLLKDVRERFHRSAIEQLPIIAMSAVFSQKDITLYHAAGFAAQVCKPFEESALLLALRDALRHGSLSRGPGP